MKKLINNIPLLAFVLTAMTALTINLSAEDVQGTKEALNPNTHTWEDITNQELGVDYNCDTEVDTDCTREMDELGQEVPDSRVEGEFKPI
ncbi:hypothetical protein KZP23_02685 [Echinicola marina]|uniref:Uncharacterized protein n=2 Tax=Echinicola TaxID=390846 RepID=L0G709_ECHVK|nr:MULTISPECIES: hypothetical protein [Echinicola]AGA80635.1 hypothetical protein Echvi_4453 [Echinicola vietnamensis DSM 17526]UCS93295.1 hypothetical protein KZP23_22040 [Echinicola marina]UCS93960.1 hypothetical protein KZP23_02685 [Echinicola marina]GGF43139.1 hypothetical protein GCM10011339_34560 [Echinicola rosea]